MDILDRINNHLQCPDASEEIEKLRLDKICNFTSNIVSGDER